MGVVFEQVSTYVYTLILLITLFLTVCVARWIYYFFDICVRDTNSKNPKERKMFKHMNF